MSTPIKSNLFNFVTLRSPQAIEDNNVKSKFISFPEGEEDKNIALSAIQNTTSVTDKDIALSKAYGKNFIALETRFAIKQQYPDLYNFALWLGRNKSSLSYLSILDNSPKDTRTRVAPTTSTLEDSNSLVTSSRSAVLDTTEIALWNQLFYNIAFKKSTEIRDLLIQLLIASNFLYEFKELEAILSDDSGTITFTEKQKVTFTRLANTSLIIPKKLIATDTTSTSTLPKTSTEEDINSTTLYGVTELGIADFRRVEQEVCCYVPGEVSHIENIMAREYKERSTRNLTVSESITESSTETEIENLTDTTSTERNEIQTEASSIVNEDNATSFGANASVSGGAAVKFSAGTNFNTSSSNSESNSNSQAQTYAQEVTERALERVVQKISTKRTSRILREFEENNTHGFDNRKGDEHVTGVYRWVDKIYKNKLINYGKRLMYEFALPEPAKFFINSYLKQDIIETNSNLVTPSKPVHPSEISERIISASTLTNTNYANVLSKYNADFIEYPEYSIIINKSFKIDFSDNNGGQEGNSISDEVEIPEGYLVDSFVINGNLFSDDDGDNHGSIILAAGKDQVEELIFDGPFNLQSRTGVNIQDSLAISASTRDALTTSFNAIVTCKRTPGRLAKWQNETYKAIIDAYAERVLEYNDFINSQVTEEITEEKKELSSQLNRAIEKRELKRMAINLMTEPYDIETTGDHYVKGSNTDILKGDLLQSHIEVVKFFEQAFDWEIMAYTFYPYFYGKQANWEKSFDYTQGNDPIFKAFLQSGMARSVVPVTPGFEDAVNWYMQTGEVWNGTGMVSDANDELYISIAEEMQTVEGEVEGTWETRVPTTLTVLQADMVVLKEGGLPCDPDCNEETLFTRAPFVAEPEGVDFDIVGETNGIE